MRSRPRGDEGMRGQSGHPMAHGRAKCERLVATPGLRSSGRGPRLAFLRKKSVDRRSRGRGGRVPRTYHDVFLGGVPRLGHERGGAETALAQDLDATVPLHDGRGAILSDVASRDSSASGSRGADEASDARQISVVRARKSPECRARSTGGPVRRTERTSGGCADGCASSGARRRE